MAPEWRKNWDMFGEGMDIQLLPGWCMAVTGSGEQVNKISVRSLERSGNRNFE